MIYREGENPALELYNLWLTMIETRNPDAEMVPQKPQDYMAENMIHRLPLRRISKVSYGAPQHGICVIGFDVYQRPVLGYGSFVSIYERSRARLIIAPDGRFAVNPETLRGNNQKFHLSQHTFLAWGLGGYRVRDNRWSIDTSHHNSQPHLHLDWRKPVSSVAQHLFWNDTWWGCVPDGSGWAMEPARDQTPPAAPTYRNDDVREARERIFTYFLTDVQRLRAHYRRLENRERLRLGLPKLLDRPARITDGHQTLETDAAIMRLAGLLTTSTPTTARGPRRPDTHGDDLVSTPVHHPPEELATD
jgi:hypothetical protein